MAAKHVSRRSELRSPAPEWAKTIRRSWSHRQLGSGLGRPLRGLLAPRALILDRSIIEASLPPPLCKICGCGVHLCMARHILSHVRESPTVRASSLVCCLCRTCLCCTTKEQEEAMKTIVSTLVALSVLAGLAAAARATTDAKQLFEQQERWSGGG